MARPGRKRAPDAKRRARTTRAARAAATVGPTPELLAQRRRVAGDATVALDFPLDVLAARHRRDPAQGVPPGQWRAGWRFARLAWRVFRPPVALPPLFWATRLERAAPAAPRDEAAAEAEAVRLRALHRAARAALAAAGPAATRAVDAAVVALVAPADAAALAALRRGLAALERHFEHAGTGVAH
ncbi:MAG: hypothetical protein IT561_02045 [Alphaproteobacteria bacterium]|nr:hypothetical protein [Alphaproteobacteria bacterium]